MSGKDVEYEEMFNQAMLLESEGKTGQSLAILQDLAKKFSSVRDPSRYARVLVNIGLMEVSLGLFKDAIIDLEKAKTQFEMVDEELEVAKVCGNIGSCYRDLDQFDEALKWYQESLDLFIQSNYLEGVADQKSNIGYIHALTGEFDSALHYFMNARQEYGRLGMDQKEHDTISNIVQIENLLSGDG